MVQERFFCKEMWLRCESSWTDMEGPACPHGRPWLSGCTVRARHKNSYGNRLPLRVVQGAYGVIYASGGWHGTENQPLICLSNVHEPAGNTRLQRAGP